jgi:hypothetical protein
MSGIEKKVIVYKKRTTANSDRGAEVRFREGKLLINRALRFGYHVVFVDESYFTVLTVNTHAYSHVNRNLVLEEPKQEESRVALVAAISAENGVEGFFSTRASMNLSTFC